MARHMDSDKLQKRCLHNINKKIKSGEAKMSDKDALFEKCTGDAEHYNW
jgi:hypothetical protein